MKFSKALLRCDYHIWRDLKPYFQDPCMTLSFIQNKQTLHKEKVYRIERETDIYGPAFPLYLRF